MNLKLYPVRLEVWQITEIERRANGNPVAPFIRSIISDWLGQDDTLQKEQILTEIDGLNGQLRLLNKKIKMIEEYEDKQNIINASEKSRLAYIKSNPNIIQSYKNRLISAKGYKILIRELDLHNKDEVNKLLSEVINTTKQKI